MDIRRGIIRAFDSGAYMADVQIVGSMATMLTGVPVAKQIGAGLLTSGAKCGVLFFDETNPSDACVVFVYDGAPPAWITSALIKDGEVTVGDLAFDPATQGELDAHAALSDVHHSEAHGASQHADRTRNMWLPAPAFDTAQGNPSLKALVAGASTPIVWAFDAAAVERIATQFLIPEDWLSGTITLKLYWAATSGGGSGDVVWNRRHSFRADGEDLNAGYSAGNYKIAVPSGWNLKVSSIGTVSGLAAGDLIVLVVSRWATHADDTYGSDAHLVGVEIEYTADM